MAKFDSEAARHAVDAQLRPGEVFRVLLPVILPPLDVGSGWGPAAIVFPLYWTARALMRRGAVRRIQARTGLPLRHRMVWATTDQRVLIFATGRRWKLKQLAGVIDRAEVVGTTPAPTVGQGWRTITFEFANRHDLQVRVPATFVEPVLAGFPHRPLS